MTDKPAMAIEPYRDRHTWLADRVRLAGWQLKIYGISASGAELAQDLVRRVVSQTEEVLPGAPNDGVACGFVQLHQGTEAIWLLIDLWRHDILEHRHFRAELDDEPVFWCHRSDSGVACVWELAVICHERSAWVRHVLSRPAAPDLEAYMADGYSLSP